jgi:hypothetical protein
MKTTANAPFRSRKEILDVLRRYKRGVARVAERAGVRGQAVSQWLAGRGASQNVWEAARPELARFPRLTGTDPGKTSKINKLRCWRCLGHRRACRTSTTMGQKTALRKEDLFGFQNVPIEILDEMLYNYSISFRCQKTVLFAFQN